MELDIGSIFIGMFIIHTIAGLGFGAYMLNQEDDLE